MLGVRRQAVRLHRRPKTIARQLSRAHGDAGGLRAERTIPEPTQPIVPRHIDQRAGLHLSGPAYSWRS